MSNACPRAVLEYGEYTKLAVSEAVPAIAAVRAIRTRDYTAAHQQCVAILMQQHMLALDLVKSVPHLQPIHCCPKQHFLANSTYLAT